MRRMISWVLIAFWTVSSIVLHGCATTTPFTQKDMSAISPLKVARYETPQIKEMTRGRFILSTIVGVALLGGVAAGLGYNLAMGSVDGEAIPDLGKLVMDKFVERASKEIPDWPIMTLEERPIPADYSYKSGTLLTFNVAEWILDFGEGFASLVEVTMTDLHGNVLWKKPFAYSSRLWDRKKSIDEYEADNFKLLKEEIGFDAEKTVSDFIEHFKNGAL